MACDLHFRGFGSSAKCLRPTSQAEKASSILVARSRVVFSRCDGLQFGSDPAVGHKTRHNDSAPR